MHHSYLSSGLFLLLFAACSSLTQPSAQPMRQAPSPMEEHIRAHQRITDTLYAGKKVVLENVLSKPITLYISSAADTQKEVDVLLHFHGADNIPIQAVNKLESLSSWQ